MTGDVATARGVDVDDDGAFGRGHGSAGSRQRPALTRTRLVERTARRTGGADGPRPTRDAARCTVTRWVSAIESVGELAGTRRRTASPRPVAARPPAAGTPAPRDTRSRERRPPAPRAARVARARRSPRTRPACRDDRPASRAGARSGARCRSASFSTNATNSTLAAATCRGTKTAGGGTPSCSAIGATSARARASTSRSTEACCRASASRPPVSPRIQAPTRTSGGRPLARRAGLDDARHRFASGPRERQARGDPGIPEESARRAHEQEVEADEARRHAPDERHEAERSSEPGPPAAPGTVLRRHARPLQDSQYSTAATAVDSLLSGKLSYVLTRRYPRRGDPLLAGALLVSSRGATAHAPTGRRALAGGDRPDRVEPSRPALAPTRPPAAPAFAIFEAGSRAGAGTTARGPRHRNGGDSWSSTAWPRASTRGHHGVSARAPARGLLGQRGRAVVGEHLADRSRPHRAARSRLAAEPAPGRRLRRRRDRVARVAGPGESRAPGQARFRAGDEHVLAVALPGIHGRGAARARPHHGLAAHPRRRAARALDDAPLRVRRGALPGPHAAPLRPGAGPPGRPGMVGAHLGRADVLRALHAADPPRGGAGLVAPARDRRRVPGQALQRRAAHGRLLVGDRDRRGDGDPVHRAGVGAIPVGIAAFLAYRAAVAIGLRRPGAAPRPAGQRLLFLRVFGYRARTEALLDRVAQRWRFDGPVQLVAGIDLATRTVDRRRPPRLPGRATGRPVRGRTRSGPRARSRRWTRRPTPTDGSGSTTSTATATRGAPRSRPSSMRAIAC